MHITEAAEVRKMALADEVTRVNANRDKALTVGAAFNPHLFWCTLVQGNCRQ